MTFSTAARVVIGGLFAGHGLQKLTGAFGGHGPDGTGQFFESLGLKPGRRHAVAAGLPETGGGALLAAGVAIPVAAAGLSATMVTAIRLVHADKGPWTTDGGWEYNAVLLAALAALTEERHGRGVALAQLAAGAVGSTLVVESGRRYVDEPGLGEPEPVTGEEQEEPRFTREPQQAPATAR